MRTHSLLIVGTLERELGLAAGAWGGASAVVQRLNDLEAAVEHLTAGEDIPELIVLAESRGVQFSAEAIHELRKLAPLARIWRLLGSWCEGETRSGRPPEGCTSTLWHRWPADAMRALADPRNGGCPPWGLPDTATADERFLTVIEQPIPRMTGSVVICVRQFETGEALADVCRLGGLDPRVVGEAEDWNALNAVGVLWDMPANDVDDARLRSFLNKAAGAPMFGLMTFPRGEDVERAIAAGMAGVISKPFLLQDLLRHFAPRPVAQGA